MHWVMSAPCALWVVVATGAHERSRVLEASRSVFFFLMRKKSQLVELLRQLLTTLRGG
jgi:hypothetical protein